MSEHVIKTISKLRIAGKYIEFWFFEDLQKVEEFHSEYEKFLIQENFHGAMKTYDFLECLEHAGIFSDILNTGAKYLKTIWKRSQHNTHWQFVSLLNEKRIVLIEKIII